MVLKSTEMITKQEEGIPRAQCRRPTEKNCRSLMSKTDGEEDGFGDRRSTIK